MGHKHKIADAEPAEVNKKKHRKVIDEECSVNKHTEVPEDNLIEENNDSSQTSNSQPVKKKKPRKIEPYWSTSKAFVAALKDTDKIGAVEKWLEAINDQQKLGKSSEKLDLTIGDAEEVEGSQMDYENDESPEHDGSTEEKSINNVEKFGDIIAPYVDAFFRAGGTVSSLLSCGRLEQSQLCTLFQALYHIMLRGNILGEIDPSWIKGECIEFLRLNADTTRHLLSTLRSARQNQLTLEFLLAMTAIDNQVAIEVMGIADLKETNVFHMANETTIEVRKAYINLITGLLVCGDPTLTRALLIRPYIITNIIPSLVWDPADTVATFLTALRCHLVQNRSILKVKKSEIFSGQILTDLLSLYRWGGPANKPATLAHISKKAKAKRARPFIEVDKVELGTVIASVHSLLLILLSDHTLGLVYKDLSIGTSSQRNYLISHVFKYVEKPWNIPALGELFVHTLIANPDVIKSVLQSMKPALEPRPTKEWSKCLDLVERVISGIHPEKLIEESLGKLSLSHLMSVVVDLCVPQILVSVLCGPNGSNLLGRDGSVTHRIAQFLTHMLANLSSVYEKMPDWREQGKLRLNEIMKVRRFVTEFLVRHFPIFSTMLKSCLAFMKSPDEMKHLDEDAPSSSETSTLKLILMYLNLCSRDDNSVASADGENHKLLMDMFDTLYVESDVHPYIRYDFYELLLALKEPSFVIDNESRRPHVKKLFCDVLSSDENVSKRAKSVLVKLIRNAALFEGNTDLPAIWLEIYRKHLRVHDVDIMIESVVRAASNPAAYRRKIEKADEKTVQKMVENERLEESLNAQLDEVCFLFERWAEEEPMVGTKGNLVCTVSYELNTISPWLPALLDVLKELQEEQTSKQVKRRQEFLRHLLVTLLFHTTQPATLIRLVVKRDRRDEILPPDLMEYLKSWGSKGSPQPLFFQDHFISNLTKFLLVEDAHPLDDIDFLRDEMSKAVLKSQDEGVSREEVVHVVRVVVFHIVELSQRGMLTSLVAERCGETLCATLSIAKQLHGDVLRKCIQIFLSNFVVFSEFCPSAVNRHGSTENLTSIIIKVLQKVSEVSEVNCDESIITTLKEPFKQKFINALSTARDLNTRIHPNSAQVVVLFHYTFQEITKMLSIACELPGDFWLEKKKSGHVLAPWGIVVAHLLQIASDSKEIASIPDSVVTKVSENIASLNAAKMQSASALEKAFLSYLKFRPQQTKFVSKDLLPSILSNSSASAESELVAVCLCKRFKAECFDNINKVMSSEGRTAFQKRLHLLVESLKGALTHSAENDKKIVHFESCLSTIRDLVKSAVTDENELPAWLASHVDFLVALLAKNKRYSVARAALFCLLKKPPIVSVETFCRVELIEKLFWTVCGPSAHPPLVLLYLKWLTASLQKPEKKDEDVLLISKLCLALLKEPPPTKVGEKETNDKKAVTWETIIDSDTWMTFVPLALMFGLQPTYIENESKGIEARSQVLHAFCQVCRNLFSHRVDNVQIATIFKLVIKHSEFQSCMTTVGPIRLELVKLLRLLIEQSQSLIEGEHFPLILSSYRATVEPADRLILQLLDKYESAGVVPPLYKSFLWGQDGASVYATMNVKNSLDEYDTNRVFSLLSVDVVHQTLLNFPINRSLDVHESYDSSCNEVYDPAFYLPILSQVTAPESPLKTFGFVRYGALALTLVALASEIEHVRTMAYSILSGFSDHLYTSKGVQVDVLNRFMDSIRVGVKILIDKDGCSSPRLSSIVAIFLARTSMVICNPLAPMYTTLNSFLLSKVEINLQSVPEFLGCMHSSTSDYRDQRTWMLDILSNGLRTEMDFQLCLNNEIPVFRFLMDMLTSCVTDVETKVGILKVFTSAVALPSGASWLVFRYGLLAWLSSTALYRFVRSAAILDAVVSLIRTLWESFTLSRSENTELPVQTIKTRISCQLLRYLLSFTSALATVESKTACDFLRTVEETYTAGHPATSHLLTEVVVESMIETSRSTVSQDVAIKCLSILKFGNDFLLDEDENRDDVTASERAASLLSLTKTWLSLRSTT